MNRISLLVLENYYRIKTLLAVKAFYIYSRFQKKKSSDVAANEFDELDNVVELKYRPDFIKVTGRNQFTNSGLSSNHNLSSLQFVIEGSKAKIILKTKVHLYYKVLVDDVIYKNNDSDYFDILGLSCIDIQMPYGIHSIKLIRCSENREGHCTIISLSTDGNFKEKLADKKYFIEFIGDSLTNGWGVKKDCFGNYSSLYQSMDGMLAYPYLVSEKLDGDCSIVAISGAGIVYKSPYSLTIGSLYENTTEFCDKNKQTCLRKADVVIINVGTNDYSHRSKKLTGEIFKEAYRELLNRVIANNGQNCLIINLSNIKNDGFQKKIEEVCDEYENCYSLKLPRSTNYKVMYHPNVDEHKLYAEIISEFVKTKLN